MKEQIENGWLLAVDPKAKAKILCNPQRPKILLSIRSSSSTGIYHTVLSQFYCIGCYHIHHLHLFLPKYLNMKLAIASLIVGSAAAFTPSSFMGQAGVAHRASAATSLDMKYKVAVVGGGPSGACAAEIFAQDKNIDTFLFERKMDNAKPCGGAIPLCMIGEFDIPETTVDRKVRLIIEIL